jgi:hypothetical protein
LTCVGVCRERAHSDPDGAAAYPKNADTTGKPGTYDDRRPDELWKQYQFQHGGDGKAADDH